MVIKFVKDVFDASISSFRYYRRLIVPLYTGMFIGLAILPFVSLIKYGYTGTFFADLDLVYQMTGGGAVTVIGSMFLVVAGAFFLLVNRLITFFQPSPLVIVKNRWWWLLAGAGVIFMGLDEVIMIHEYLTRKMQDIGIPKPFGIDQDIYIFAVYGIATLVVGYKLAPSIYNYRRAVFPLVAMVVFFGTSEVIDFIPWHSLTPVQEMIFDPIEEIIKTMGEWSILIYAGLLIEEVIRLIPQQSVERYPHIGKKE